MTGRIFRPGGCALTDQVLALCGFPPGAVLLDLGCLGRADTWGTRGTAHDLATA